MKLRDLRLLNYRNHKELYIKFNGGLNIICGRNSVGKTNILEAIHLCLKGKSFKNSKDEEMINFDSQYSNVFLNLEIENTSEEISIDIRRGSRKSYKVNNEEIKLIRDLKNQYKCVIFEQDMLKIIKEGPKNRRDFVDNLISDIRNDYSVILKNYNKVLFIRNEILKFGNNKKYFKERLISSNNQLISEGVKIIKKREEYAKKINTIANEVYKNINNNFENLNFKYVPDIEVVNSDIKTLSLEFFNNLKETYNNDLKIKMTSKGPHKDDFLIEIDEKNSRIYSSAGQQRSALLALKISELDIIRYYSDISPVLLLDDVFSELDRGRIYCFLNYIKGLQSILTIADDSQLKDILKDKNIECNYIYL